MGWVRCRDSNSYLFGSCRDGEGPPPAADEAAHLAKRARVRKDVLEAELPSVCFVCGKQCASALITEHEQECLQEHRQELDELMQSFKIEGVTARACAQIRSSARVQLERQAFLARRQ
eukprot:3360582-Rhodomonas_salina.1